jgi:ectoine hydroxylase-related dioxygenase (phytanoyl-CoA dioxygenase family)
MKMKDEDVGDIYWRKGYVHIPRLFDLETMNGCLGEIDGLMASGAHRDPLNLRYESRKSLDGVLVVDRIDPILDILPTMDLIARSPIIGQILSRIFSKPVSLLKSKVIIKAPGTLGYMAHQDFLYWRWLSLPPASLCSVIVSLADTLPNSGGITYYPGLHAKLLESVEHGLNGDIDKKYLDMTIAELPNMAQGDVVIFHSLTPHESKANRSDSNRTVMISSYAAIEDESLYRQYYDREISRRLESYRTGRGDESLARFKASLKHFSAQL